LISPIAGNILVLLEFNGEQLNMESENLDFFEGQSLHQEAIQAIDHYFD